MNKAKITYIRSDYWVNRQVLQDGTDQFLGGLADRGLGLFEYLGVLRLIVLVR